jgi:hypothetical protein
MACGHLVIVTRRNPSLYAYLERTFSGVSGVIVIHDRRTVAADDASAPPMERRSRPEIAAQIHAYGYAVVAMGGFEACVS